MVRIPHWPKIPIFHTARKIDLELSYTLLNAVGNPHKKLPPVIHIAGTNGKGSTLAMLKSIFTKAGYITHRYISPHLIEFNERIELAGVAITDSHLYDVLDRVRSKSEQLNLQPSFFEATTVAAFLAFSEIHADILLLETGLGGRLDCTNVISDPILTIITPISLDHTEYLGNDLLQIAYEKSGIIKRNTSCVIGVQKENIYQYLIGVCEKQKSKSFCYEHDYYIKIINQHEKNQNSQFKYYSRKFTIDFPIPNLIGEHQIFNASSAIASIMLINDRFNITLKTIKEALQSIIWPGRVQLIDDKITQKIIKNESHKNTKIYIDGAHNESGAAALSCWARNNLEGSVYMILGMTRNRNVNEFCAKFKDIISCVVAVKVQYEPSSYNASTIKDELNNSGIKAIASESIPDAIAKIIKLHNTSISNKSDNSKNTINIIVTGSLFLISDFLMLSDSMRVDI